MDIDKFKNFIISWKGTVDKNMELQKVGVYIHDLILDPYWGIITPLLETIFSEEQIYHIDNFIYNESEISIEELYDKIYSKELEK